MSEPVVIVEKDGHTQIVTLNRPEKKNAVNCEMMCRLYDAWVQLDLDDDVRVAILTGRGDTFCAGMDLGEIGKFGLGWRSGTQRSDRRKQRSEYFTLITPLETPLLEPARDRAHQWLITSITFFG